MVDQYISSNTWDDEKNYFDPYQFQGDFVSVTLAAGLAWGVGYSAVRVGEYRSTGFFHSAYLGIGFSETADTSSQVIDISEWECSCEE